MAMASPTRTTARTEESPVEKLAQCKLTRENPLLDWSRDMSEEELLTEDDFSVVLGVNGGTLGYTPARVAVLAKVFLDEHLLTVVVDNTLSVPLAA